MKQPKLNPLKSTGLKKKKKKRKFRAMTNSEFCRMYAGLKKFDCRNCSLYRQTDDCELVEEWELNSKKPYKTKDGKYILVEVKKKDRKL